MAHFFETVQNLNPSQIKRVEEAPEDWIHTTEGVFMCIGNLATIRLMLSMKSQQKADIYRALGEHTHKVIGLLKMFYTTGKGISPAATKMLKEELGIDPEKDLK